MSKEISKIAKQNNRKKILVTGGGTGGHILPLMAVVNELKKNDAKILYVGSGNKLEKEFSKKFNIGYKSILSGKLRRYFDWQNVLDIFKVVVGFIQSIFIILLFWPDRVFSKGGYVGLPVVYAAWILGRPIYVHETDAIAGLANRMSEKKSRKIFVSFPPKYYPDLPISKVIYSGSPVREDIINAKKEKLFDNSKPTLLITGGSQGSRFINQTVAAIMDDLTKKYNVVHVSGKLDYDWLKQNKWENYKLYDFTIDMPKMLKNADLIISRSGGTIFEIATCKKPAILIPLASAANNHQEANAQILEKENAAIVLREKGLTPESLREIIDRVMEDKKLMKEMSERLSGFYKEDAAKVIANEILSSK